MPSQLKSIWNLDINNRRRLAELLRDPVLAMAVALVREEGRPKGKPVPAEALLTANALENTRVHGWHGALDALENLVNTSSQKRPQEQEPHQAEAERALHELGLAPTDQPKQNP